MKYAYLWARLLLAALFLFIGLNASAQQWRPFWPGLIYSYDLRNGTNTTHTLRVDSVYRTTVGDSVYAFNRLMRRYVSSPNTGVYAKSRNNLFGARLSWVPGQRYYTFESDAQSGVQSGASRLRIYPQAATGQSWIASSSPMLTATVQSRGLRIILPGVQDSVATVEVRAGTATTGPALTTLVLSRSYGLIEGTPWLGGAVLGTPISAPLVAAEPVPLLQSPYSPLTLFTMQPGDELGYLFEEFNYNNPSCTQLRTLRRILTRQQRADSLVFTYQEQTQNKSLYNGPNCSPTPSTSIQPSRTGRLAFSLINGRSTAYPGLQLLTGEYASDASFISRPSQLMGLGVVATTENRCQTSGPQLQCLRVYENNSNTVPTYAPGLDIFAWMQVFGPTPGMGDVATYLSHLVYYRRSIGNPLVCGSFIDFAGLLPSRAAQAAALATLHPNPAAEVATLTLVAPARPGTTLRLTDALGRQVWSAPVAVGQTTAAVPLAGQPAGFYLLHLEGSGTAASWKLAHE